uniref:VRR-NUC domain-containing protein n=1 Tax=viral metagenome TaxID=1070528 RepID=A0A6H2A0C8_9ZZZZ
MEIKESNLKRQLEDYLQFQQNLGRLLFLRLNAGNFIELRGNNRRRIKGCPKGTADLLVLAGGKVTFLELKSKRGKLTDAQVEFSRAAWEQGADYHIIRSLEEVRELEWKWKDGPRS